jgi:hypothetical protein
MTNILPLCFDLYCGLGGWAEGFISEGFHVIGYDIEKHDYGTGTYPGELILCDVRSIHGSQCKDAMCIVASPPCQEPSYRAMPWKRAKALNAIGPPHNFIELFNACFRIQREASEAAGHYIPLIVENVCGAQRWVGRARWHFGSYYLWGDVPALMPITLRCRKSQHIPLVETPPGTGATSWFFGNSKHEARFYGTKNEGQDWNRHAITGEISPHWRMEGLKTKDHLNIRNGHNHTRHLTNHLEHVRIDESGIKLQSPGHYTKPSSGPDWFDGGPATHSSKSSKRKLASAQIAKIPFPLAQWIARCFKPHNLRVVPA